MLMNYVNSRKKQIRGTRVRAIVGLFNTRISPVRDFLSVFRNYLGSNVTLCTLKTHSLCHY